MFSSNDELYAGIRRISNDLRSRGKLDDAKRLEIALESGYTSGEVLGELLLALQELERQGVFKNTRHANTVNGMIKAIKKAIK